MEMDKTWVRIDEKYMQVLGVKSGDIVKISGSRTTGAICLPLDPESKQSHVDVIYHDESSKKIPPIQLGNIVCSNIRGGNVGELVEVSKAKAVEAERIVLGTIVTYTTENLALGKLEGLIVSKEDRVNIPHSDSHSITPFQVVNAIPASDFWIIGKNTKIEFDKISADTFYNLYTLKLGKLINVIPVIKQISSKSFDLTFPSIEIYDNATRFNFYIKDRVDNPNKGVHANLRPTIKAWDDLGNSYVIEHWQGHGGHQSGTDDFEHEMSGILVPALDHSARELNFVILEMIWQIMLMPSPGVAANKVQKDTAFNYMTPAEMTIEIASGPWEFKIPLR